MTHRHVPIRRQHHQEQGGRDLIDGGRGEVDLAHRHPERPLAKRHCGDQEGNPDQETLVGHSEVENVGVSDCVHFGEPKVHNPQ